MEEIATPLYPALTFTMAGFSTRGVSRYIPDPKASLFEHQLFGQWASCSAVDYR